MSRLSIDQFEKAKKYDPQFRTAVYSRYLRAQPTSYYSDFAELCAELKIHLKMSCPACMLNAMTQLGRMYFETLEEMQKSEQTKQTEEPVKSDVQTNAKPQKSDSSEKPKIAKKPVVTRSQKPKTNKK